MVLDARDLQEKVSTLEHRLDQFEQIKKAREKTARRFTVLLGMLGFAVFLIWGGVALSDQQNCVQGGFLCIFDSNNPAKVSEVNHNFAQTKKWIERKVGTLNEDRIHANSIWVHDNGYDSSTRIDLGEPSFQPASIIHARDDSEGELWLSFSEFSGGESSEGQIVFGQYPQNRFLEVKANGDTQVYKNLTVEGSITASACPKGYHDSAPGTQNGFCFTDMREGNDKLYVHVAHMQCLSEGADLCSVGQYYITDAKRGKCSEGCWAKGYCGSTRGISVIVGVSWDCANWGQKRKYRCCRPK